MKKNREAIDSYEPIASGGGGEPPLQLSQEEGVSLHHSHHRTDAQRADDGREHSDEYFDQLFPVGFHSNLQF